MAGKVDLVVRSRVRKKSATDGSDGIAESEVRLRSLFKMLRWGREWLSKPLHQARRGGVDPVLCACEASLDHSLTSQPPTNSF